jgi:hypothetical protein
LPLGEFVMSSPFNGTVVINAWVSVQNGCRITYTASRGSGAGFTVLGKHGGNEGGNSEFEFFFETDALREFLRLGTEALAELDVPPPQQETETPSAQGDHRRVPDGSE